MDATIMLVLISIVVTWSLLNLLYRIGFLKKIVSGVEIHYGLLMIAKRSKVIPPSTKNRAKLLGVIGILVYSICFVISILTLLSIILYRAQVGERGVVILIPGFNITGKDLVFFLLWVFLAVSLHEYLHAKVAVKSGVPVKSWGFILAVILPAAFVEVDEPAFKASPRLAKIAVLSAGIAANFALLLVSMFILQFMVNPYGLIIVDVDPESLAARSGIKPYDVIYEINDMKATVDTLRQQLGNHEVSVIRLLIYRCSEGFKEVIIIRDINETKLGVTIYPTAPNYGIIRVIKPEYFIHLSTALYWSYVVNFSLMFINTLPLFITDGGRILSSVLGEKAGKLANAIATALFIATLIISARI